MAPRRSRLRVQEKVSNAYDRDLADQRRNGSAKESQRVQTPMCDKPEKTTSHGSETFEPPYTATASNKMQTRQPDRVKEYRKKPAEAGCSAHGPPGTLWPESIR